MGRLTTHVLNTANGKAASGVKVELFSRMPGPVPASMLLGTCVTNADGRCDSPLIEGDAMKSGEYELVFHVGEYFRALGVVLADPPFLGEVVIRVGIAHPDQHYHVPLLLSPWSYSTYRGS